MTNAEETISQAVSPVSAFNAAGAAAAASCAATFCTLRAVHPATMTRQIRRTGRILFILLIAESIVASFHLLVRTRLSLTIVTLF
jgi:hypothetical protein